MKRLVFLSALMFLVSPSLLASSFNDADSVVKFEKSITDRLYSSDSKSLYTDMEDKAEDNKDSSEALLWMDRIGRFAGRINEPARFEQDPGLRRSVGNAREEAVEFLVDLAKYSDIPLSVREYAVEMLGRIVQAEHGYNPDITEAALEGLIDVSHKDNPLLVNAALSAIIPVILKEGEPNEDFVEDAMKAMEYALEHDDQARSEHALFLSMLYFKKARILNEQLEDYWDEVIDRIYEVESPSTAIRLRRQVEVLLGSKMHSSFHTILDRTKIRVNKLGTKVDSINRPLDELLKDLARSEKGMETERLLQSIIQKGQNKSETLNGIYTKLVGVLAANNLPPIKAALIYEGLNKITEQVNSPLQFYRSSLFYLGEQSRLSNKPQAETALAMLHQLLSSTDHLGMLGPVLQEIGKLAKSSLPIWQRRRLILLLYAHAGDSPNYDTAMVAANELRKLMQEAGEVYVRTEAALRLNQLKETAKLNKLKASIQNW